MSVSSSHNQVCSCVVPPPPFKQCCGACWVSLRARNIASQHCIWGGRGGQDLVFSHFNCVPTYTGPHFTCNISSVHCTTRRLIFFILSKQHSPHSGMTGKLMADSRKHGPLHAAAESAGNLLRPERSCGQIHETIDARLSCANCSQSLSGHVAAADVVAVAAA